MTSTMERASRLKASPLTVYPFTNPLRLVLAERCRRCGQVSRLFVTTLHNSHHAERPPQLSPLPLSRTSRIALEVKGRRMKGRLRSAAGWARLGMARGKQERPRPALSSTAGNDSFMTPCTASSTTLRLRVYV